MILLVLFFLPFACSNYTFTCPTKRQWSLRSRKCENASYFCLLDINTHSYKEQCLPFPAKDTKGFRKVFAGNVDGIKCALDTYQPFWFLTDGSSDCVYKKSLCSEEGQVVQDDGSNVVDRRCRCDHRNGYNYVIKPRDICNCVPSEEDCSCYRMPCPQDHLLTPDYECRKITEWKHTFGCPGIQISPPVEKSTVVVSKVTPEDTDQPDSSRNVVQLFVFSSLLIIIGLLVFWMYCKPCKHEALSEVITQDIKGLDRSSINQKDSKRQIPLSYAADKGYAEVVKLLQDIISEFNIYDNDDDIPLDMACGSQTVYTLLLSNKAAFMQYPAKLNAALYIVCREDDQDSANLILSEFEAIAIQDVINLTNEHGYTPLHISVMQDNLQITKMLIEKNASINCLDNKDRTPLHHACRINSLAMVKLLIKHGADILIEDTDGNLPLHVSHNTDNVEISELLYQEELKRAKFGAE